jgi:mannose-6-phosphate isomerase-like protein (cupin superfamily)
MQGFVTNIEEQTKTNEFFRQVLYTASHCQLVVMALQPGEDIGMEVHADHDQFIRVESGRGVAIMDGVQHPITDGSAVVIPAGTQHNIINSAEGVMKLYTLYAPPEHKDGTIHKTKEEALEEHHE